RTRSAARPRRGRRGGNGERRPLGASKTRRANMLFWYAGFRGNPKVSGRGFGAILCSLSLNTRHKHMDREKAVALAWEIVKKAHEPMNEVWCAEARKNELGEFDESYVASRLASLTI